MKLAIDFFKLNDDELMTLFISKSGALDEVISEKLAINQLISQIIKVLFECAP